MGRRINDLVEASYVTVPHEREWDSEAQVFDKNLFAELLIKDACEKMQEADSFYGEWMSTIIKHHFGVE